MKANINKGEVAFEVDGAEYIFKFGINAQAMIEEKANMSIGKFVNQMQTDFGAKDLRLIFYACLSEHHSLSEQEVGNLIDRMGGEAASQIFLKAAQASQETMKRAPNGVDTTARPTKAAKERIGMNS